MWMYMNTGLIMQKLVLDSCDDRAFTGIFGSCSNRKFLPNVFESLNVMVCKFPPN